jgi:hypothetical protein
MLKALRLALLSVVALNAPVGAQTPPPVQTKSYVYEQIHLRLENAGGHQLITGALFMEDVTNRHSQMELSVRNHATGALLYACSSGSLRNGRNDGDNIVQVGPFAQEAQADATGLLALRFNDCARAPTSLIVHCPFQGIRAPQAPNYVTFTHSGTYRDGPFPGSYSQQGRHGPTRCAVSIDGIAYNGIGTLTHIKETRRGQAVDPNLRWRDPHRWLRVEDTFEGEFRP